MDSAEEAEYLTLLRQQYREDMELKDLVQGVSRRQRQLKSMVEEVRDNQRADISSKVQKCAESSHNAEQMQQDPAEAIEDLIRNNYTLLRKRLQVEKLIPHFIERRLLDFPEEKQVAMSKTTAPGKAEALLELLTEKGTCTPEAFVEILKKGGHQHVADQLKRTSTHSKTTKEMRHLAGKVQDEIFEQLLPKDTKNTPDQLWSYIQENQNDVLFILDGLDELSQAAREVTDVVDLIQGKILRNCHVLVTSRPYHCVKDLEKCHQFYKIIGYSKENSEEFIQKYFCEYQESASKLVDQLQSNRNLSEIVVNPLNNVLICVMWEENGEKLPTSKAELYEMIVHSVAKTHCTRINLPMESDKFLPDIEDALRGLRKLSWEGLEQEQLQFNISEITEKYGTTADIMLNMGLLTRDYSFSRIKRTCYCAFLHKTFQEYMAARYISGLVMDGSSREEGMKCVCRLFGLSDATVVNTELIITSQRKYTEVQNWLLLILGENSRPIFVRVAEELRKAQTDEDRKLLSFFCIMWLGTTFAGGKMADIVASCLSQHATNKLDDFVDNEEDLWIHPADHANWCVGLAHVLTCQKKLPASHGTSFIQHLTIEFDLVDAAQEKLDVLENALSDYDAIRSVTLLGIDNYLEPCSLLREYIPRCGTESVFIGSNRIGISYLSLLSFLEELSAVARIEHVTAQFGIYIGEGDIELSEFDRLLARMIESHTRLRSLRLEISCLIALHHDLSSKIFSNLTATLQSISEHTRLEVVKFDFPGKYHLAETDYASVFVEDQHEALNVELLVDRLTECVKKNKVLKTLRIRCRTYQADCSSQSLSSLCSAIRENRTLETLVVEGMLFHSECRAEMISELIRNKPSNYKELQITLSDIPFSSQTAGLHE